MECDDAVTEMVDGREVVAMRAIHGSAFAWQRPHIPKMANSLPSAVPILLPPLPFLPLLPRSGPHPIPPSPMNSAFARATCPRTIAKAAKTAMFTIPVNITTSFTPGLSPVRLRPHFAAAGPPGAVATAGLPLPLVDRDGILEPRRTPLPPP